MVSLLQTGSSGYQRSVVNCLNRGGHGGRGGRGNWGVRGVLRLTEWLSVVGLPRSESYQLSVAIRRVLRQRMKRAYGSIALCYGAGRRDAVFASAG